MEGIESVVNVWSLTYPEREVLPRVENLGPCEDSSESNTLARVL